ncbi:MAG: hypothetical protein KF767_00050 [Bdellovibrionaceae bacterium]|nr:hypothetical protein [Pseudobdellovibrionaceae bacterium]
MSVFKSALVAGMLLAFSVVAQAQQNKFLDMLPIFKNGKIVDRGVFRDKVPTFEELRANAARIPSYETFIDELLRQAPALRENHILIHHSESQQLSSLTHPRVILFGGGMAFGLADDPRQEERRVEIMQVDPKTYTISMHEIVFHESGPEFVEKPTSCAACHGQNPKPLWNPYDFWPNTFGSAIGFVGTSEETRAYQEIYARRAELPSLRGLKLGAKISQDTENVTAFTQYAHQINLGRFSAQNLGPASGIDDFADPLIAVFSYCAADRYQKANHEKLREFFHPDDAKLLPDLRPIETDMIASRGHFKNFLDRMQERIFPSGEVKFKVDHSRLADETGTLAQIRYVFELAGVDATNLTTSLIANDTLISAPSNTPIDFLGSFYEARPDLFKNVKLVPVDLNDGRKSWMRADCESLKAKSRKIRRRFASTRAWTEFKTDAPMRPVISRCAKCHVEGLGDAFNPAPTIPFDQPAKLATLLQAPQSRLREKIALRIREARGTQAQMPPGQALREEDIDSLLAFLDVLGKPPSH